MLVRCQTSQPVFLISSARWSGNFMMMRLPGWSHPIRLDIERRRHPEWWLVGLVAACWLAIIVRHVSAGDHGGMAHPSMEMSGTMPPGHVHHAPVAASAATSVTSATDSIAGFFADWTLMTMAMMLPLIIPVVRQIAFNSVRSRQVRSTSIVLVAYSTVWIALGAPIIVAEQLLVPDRDVVSFGPILVILAALWQLTPWKRQAINACRVDVPLRPFRIRADLACAQVGLLHGWRCLRSCWVLMLAMVAIGHGPIALVVMALMTVIAIAEERSRSCRRFLQQSAGLLVATSLIVFVV
jgi:predicted metal-binding membrane protein